MIGQVLVLLHRRLKAMNHLLEFFFLAILIANGTIFNKRKNMASQANRQHFMYGHE